MREREEESMQEEEWMHGRDFWLLNFFYALLLFLYLCFWEWCVGWSLYMCPFINTPLSVQWSRRVTPCSWLSRVWIMQDTGRRYRGGKRFFITPCETSLFLPCGWSLSHSDSPFYWSMGSVPCCCPWPYLWHWYSRPLRSTVPPHMLIT